jgi:hypothetical protein
MTALDVPVHAGFLCFASNGARVIALCKHSGRADAEAWAERARQGFLKFADQVAILSPEQVLSIRGGREARWGCVAGWVRTGQRWGEADPARLRLDFAELEPG